MRSLGRAVAQRSAIIGLGLALFSGTASAITFNMINGDGPGEGFNDPALGAQRIAAFEYALDIWGGLLQESYPGEIIDVFAVMNPMGGTATKATLGSAGPGQFWIVTGAPTPDGGVPTVYGDALTDHLVGFDVDPLIAEIGAAFNSDVDNGTVLGATDWYYGLDASPGGHIDFVSVVLHEVGHGLNFLDTIQESGAWWFTNAAGTPVPGIYDRFLVEGAVAGTRLVDMNDAGRAAAITSEDLYWMGTAGVAANGGALPEIYAPATYEGGSSVAHLDETVFPTALMSPYYSGPQHTVGAIELGMLEDMGWTLVIPEPASLGLLGLGLLALARRRR